VFVVAQPLRNKPPKTTSDKQSNLVKRGTFTIRDKQE
jgi:hypothetical protein